MREATGLADEVLLFAESATRFLMEVRQADVSAFEECLAGVPLMRVGQTCKEPRLRVARAGGEWIIWAAWPS